MKNLFTLFLLLSLSSLSHAGALNDAFGDGVFGVSWGATLQEVKNIHPGGDIDTYGAITHYSIEDGRSLLNVERYEDEPLIFAFTGNPQRLTAIGANFGGSQYTEVLYALQGAFGPTDSTPGASSSGSALWPVDEGIKMYLSIVPSGFSTSTSLTIENVNPNKDFDKGSMGFNE